MANSEVSLDTNSSHDLTGFTLESASTGTSVDEKSSTGRRGISVPMMSAVAARSDVPSPIRNKSSRYEDEDDGDDDFDDDLESLNALLEVQESKQKLLRAKIKLKMARDNNESRISSGSRSKTEEPAPLQDVQEMEEGAEELDVGGDPRAGGNSCESDSKDNLSSELSDLMSEEAKPNHGEVPVEQGVWKPTLVMRMKRNMGDESKLRGETEHKNKTPRETSPSRIPVPPSPQKLPAESQEQLAAEAMKAFMVRIAAMPPGQQKNAIMGLLEARLKALNLAYPTRIIEIFLQNDNSLIIKLIHDAHGELLKDKLDTITKDEHARVNTQLTEMKEDEKRASEIQHLRDCLVAYQEQTAAESENKIRDLEERASQRYEQDSKEANVQLYVLAEQIAAQKVEKDQVISLAQEAIAQKEAEAREKSIVAHETEEQARYWERTYHARMEHLTNQCKALSDTLEERDLQIKETQKALKSSQEWSQSQILEMQRKHEEQIMKLQETILKNMTPHPPQTTAIV